MSRKLTPAVFDEITRDMRFHSTYRGKPRDVKQALRLILVDGRTWKEATAITGVTAPTIYRAIKRLDGDVVPSYEELLKDRRELLLVLRPIVRNVTERMSTTFNVRDPLIVRARKLTETMKDH